MATTIKPNKSCRLGPANRRPNGTARTNGNPTRLTDDAATTCAISSLSDARMEAARLWVLDEQSKPVSKKEFVSRAIDALTMEVLAANPDFKLPPSCSFDCTKAN